MPDSGANTERHPEPLVQLQQVVKHYQSLRPLRVQNLIVRPGDALALLGFDAATAEVLVSLITAGTLPDEGQITVFGQATAAITDHAAWVTVLDRFGLVSQRSVLLDQLTAEQNLAIPFTLAVESMGDEVRQTVRALADEISLPAAHLQQQVTTLPASSVLRIRLGRALALRPDVLLAEHPNATLTSAEALAFAKDLSTIRRGRGLATVVLTADKGFAEAIGSDVLTLQPATGELRQQTGWRRWFG